MKLNFISKIASRLYSALLLGLSTLGVSSCSEPVSVADPDLVEKVLKDRVLEKSLEYQADGDTHRYSLSIPRSYDSKSKLPVIVYLHGKGGDENSELLYFSFYVNSIAKECGIEQPLIIFPSNQNGLYLLDQGQHLANRLLQHIAPRFSVEAFNKRILAGFSIGGAAATRTAIIHPNSYAVSVSWAGGLWPNDAVLFSSVKNNAGTHIENNFTAHLFIGGEDSPHLYDPLISAMKEYEVSYNRLLLKRQKHNLGQYLERTREEFKSVMCTVFK